MNRKNFAIRALSVLLCTLMLVGMIPFSVSADSTPVALIEAKDISLSLGSIATAFGVDTSTYDPATGIRSFKTTKSATIADNHRLGIDLASANVVMKSYPYVAVGMSVTGLAGTKVDLDTSTKPGGRMWGRQFAPSTTGTIDKLIIDAPGYTSGEGSYGGYSNSGRDNAIYDKLSLRLGVQGQKPAAGVEFKIQYVAFFATEADAQAYVYEYDAPAKVTFLDADGGEFSSYYVGDETTVTIPEEVPTATGKKFVKWVDATGAEVNAETAITADSDDLTVYPEFVNAYSVKFMSDDATLHEDIAFVEGDTLTYPETDPVADGFIFKGWDAPEEGTAVTADAAYNAIWATAYDVAFYVDADAEAAETRSIEENTAVGELPVAPEKKGYDFVEWNTAEDGTSEAVTAETVVTSDINAYAVYEVSEETPIRVIYMLDETNVYEIVYGTTSDVLADLVPANNPSLPGYTFDGWDYANATGIDDGADLEAIIGTYLAEDNFDITVAPTFTKNAAYGESEEVVADYVLYTVDNGSLTYVSGSKYTGTKVAASGEESAYIRFTATAGTLNDADRSRHNFADVDLSKTPVMKIGYRANFTPNKEINLWFGNSRLWGGRLPDMTGDSAWNALTVDLSTLGWTGGDGVTSWSAATTKAFNGILLRPFGGNGATHSDTSRFFDVNYIAFFPTTAAADAFEYTGVATMEIDGKTVTVVEGQNYVLPEATIVPNKNFDYYEDGNGQIYSVGDTITAVDGLVLTAVYKDAESFTINYYDADGTLITTVEGYPLNTEIKHSDYVQLSVPEGQTFDGWYNEGTLWQIEDGYVVDRDLNLVASYDATYRYVTYMVNDQIYDSQSYAKGASIELVTAPVIGDGKYADQFLGWKNQDNKQVILNGYKVNENLVLYADYATFDVSEDENSSLIFIAILKKIQEKKYGKVETVVNGPVAIF
ncbi:MAG: InlB B-repeat-containing protein, partial [Clostridia bacterium]|nr:InlB B-repeat-containing protein [Clostridia bacterium]